MSGNRQRQLEYSELQKEMGNEATRRLKAQKILRVIAHHRGRADLTGVRILDIGCSLGWLVAAAAEQGADTVGVDIDVPGLTRAARERGPGPVFLCADGEGLPLPDASVDVVVLNHIYEHVVDPDAVLAEIRRVLRPEGLVYLGLANKLGVVEPHYKLPFLSYLPRRAADRYVSAFGRAEAYHERFRLLPGLYRLVRGLYVFDYTFAILADPVAFGAGDVVPGPAPAVFSRLGRRMRGALRPLAPTYIWVASPSPTPPRGPALPVPPDLVSTPAR